MRRGKANLKKDETGIAVSCSVSVTTRGVCIVSHSSHWHLLSLINVLLQTSAICLASWWHRCDLRHLRLRLCDYVWMCRCQDLRRYVNAKTGQQKQLAIQCLKRIERVEMFKRCTRTRDAQDGLESRVCCFAMFCVRLGIGLPTLAAGLKSPCPSATVATCCKLRWW